MTKGRTKNKRARKPVGTETTGNPIPAAKTAYFDLPNGHGYAEYESAGKFFHPSDPVTSFRVYLLRSPAQSLKWTRTAGWTGNLAPDVLDYAIPSIEKTFTPLRYRFQPILI